MVFHVIRLRLLRVDCFVIKKIRTKEREDFSYLYKMWILHVGSMEAYLKVISSQIIRDILETIEILIFLKS